MPDTRLSAAFSLTASGLKLTTSQECILKYKTGETFNDDVIIVKYIDRFLIS